MNRQILQQACETLEAGGLIAYPTEAVWGLGCDPQSYSSVKRILALKGRSQDKGLILVAAGVHQLGKLLAGLTAQQLGLIEASWPGPTTWLIPDPANLFPGLDQGQTSIHRHSSQRSPIGACLMRAFRKAHRVDVSKCGRKDGDSK